jgi:hypothetical protein
MSSEAPQGYRYHNPNEADPSLNTFEVVPSIAEDGDFTALAADYQAIEYAVSQEMYSGYFSPEQIAQTVNPDNPRLVSQQAKCLSEAADAGVQNYLHARIAVPPLSPGLGQYVTGIAHVEYDMSGGLHRRVPRLTRRAESPQAADISAIFVRPTFLGGNDIDLQGNGFGSALTFSLLDKIPDDNMPLIVRAFPINREVQPLLRKFGFHVVDLGSAAVKLFNTQTFNRDQYRGPTRGELRQQLVDTAPWLAHREPIEG